MFSLYYFRSFTLLLILVNAPLVLSSETVQLNRYQRIDVSPSEQAQDLFSSVVEAKFPESVNTIGDALAILLDSNGFSLDVESGLLHQYLLLNLPLPDAYRVLPPQSLRDTVKLMAGEAYRLRINPVHRTVGFLLKKDYLRFVKKGHALKARKKWRDLHSNSHKKSSAPTYIDSAISYRPVVVGDTLTKIVNNLPLSWLTTDQKLVALFDANPQAFGNRNMNHLLLDAVLMMPTSKEKYLLSARKATAIVEQHARQWKALKVR